MKITFLGTGTSQGVPIIGCKCKVCTSQDTKDKRLRSSVMIEVPTENSQSSKQLPNLLRFVIDTGPDFRHQMLRENVGSIDAVIYTHDHRDHVAGLDDIRALNFIMKKPVDLYATEATQKGIEQQFSYIFKNRNYPGLPEINFHRIENKPFEIQEVKFTPIEVRHLHLPVLGFRIGNFSYITDANYISEEEKNKIKGSEVLVLNALRMEKHPSHFTLKEATEIAQELDCKITYLTHISHQLGLHQEIEASLPTNIRLAYDGLCLKV